MHFMWVDAACHPSVAAAFDIQRDQSVVFMQFFVIQISTMSEHDKHLWQAADGCRDRREEAALCGPHWPLRRGAALCLV
jgi:hypothetical protein